MSEKRENQPERRHSTESRLDMLEYRLDQLNLVINEIQEDKNEMLEILRKLESDQARTQTIIGGAAFLASGAIAGAWYLAKELLAKFLH